MHQHPGGRSGGKGGVGGFPGPGGKSGANVVGDLAVAKGSAVGFLEGGGVAAGCQFGQGADRLAACFGHEMLLRCQHHC